MLFLNSIKIILFDASYTISKEAFFLSIVKNRFDSKTTTAIQQHKEEPLQWCFQWQA